MNKLFLLVLFCICLIAAREPFPEKHFSAKSLFLSEKQEYFLAPDFEYYRSIQFGFSNRNHFSFGTLTWEGAAYRETFFDHEGLGNSIYYTLGNTNSSFTLGLDLGFDRQYGSDRSQCDTTCFEWLNHLGFFGHGEKSSFKPGLHLDGYYGDPEGGFTFNFLWTSGFVTGYNYLEKFDPAESEVLIDYLSYEGSLHQYWDLDFGYLNNYENKKGKRFLYYGLANDFQWIRIKPNSRPIYRSYYESYHDVYKRVQNLSGKQSILHTSALQFKWGYWDADKVWHEHPSSQLTYFGVEIFKQQENILKNVRQGKRWGVYWSFGEQITEKEFSDKIGVNLEGMFRLGLAKWFYFEFPYKAEVSYFPDRMEENLMINIPYSIYPTFTYRSTKNSIFKLSWNLIDVVHEASISTYQPGDIFDLTLPNQNPGLLDFTFSWNHWF